MFFNVKLSDWSYDISKYMIKDKNRLIAEKSIFSNSKNLKG